MKAVFLDRDGVICKDTDHLWKIEDFKFEDNAIEGLKKLSDSEYKLVIITNQAVIGRGMCTEEDYEKLQDFMLAMLKESGIKILATYMCPHHPEKGIPKYKTDCECRKPKPGMFIKAAKEHNIDLKKSWTIGDKTSDILAGKNAGIRTILVKTGYAGEDGLHEAAADYIADDLKDAAEIILGESW